MKPKNAGLLAAAQLIFAFVVSAMVAPDLPGIGLGYYFGSAIGILIIPYVVVLLASFKSLITAKEFPAHVPVTSSALVLIFCALIWRGSVDEITQGEITAIGAIILASTAVIAWAILRPRYARPENQKTGSVPAELKGDTSTGNTDDTERASLAEGVGEIPVRAPRKVPLSANLLPGLLILILLGAAFIPIAHYFIPHSPSQKMLEETPTSSQTRKWLLDAGLIVDGPEVEMLSWTDPLPAITAALDEWAQVGDVDSQYLLGRRYMSGTGTIQDYTRGVCWLRIASHHEDPRAMNSLGFAYEMGRGVQRSHVNAHLWYNLAAARGLEAAANNPDRLNGMLRAEQIAEAQAQAREWLPNPFIASTGVRLTRPSTVYSNEKPFSPPKPPEDLARISWCN